MRPMLAGQAREQAARRRTGDVLGAEVAASVTLRVERTFVRS
jgi:hypothetical protein